MLSFNYAPNKDLLNTCNGTGMHKPGGRYEHKVRLLLFLWDHRRKNEEWGKCVRVAGSDSLRL